jgi:CubicO group peptidase (beta-lactamase class C family)
MATGHVQCLFKYAGRWEVPNNWATKFFNFPPENEPGSHYCYNTGASYWLSAIVTKVTGKNVTQYLQEKLTRPLGIRDVRFQLSPDGIDTGGFGFEYVPRDLAVVGQFLAASGCWKGKQLLSSAWITEMTTPHIAPPPQVLCDLDARWSIGYGYQTWILPGGAFAAFGMDGQFLSVWPQSELVVVLTANTQDSSALVEVVTQNLA